MKTCYDSLKSKNVSVVVLSHNRREELYRNLFGLAVSCKILGYELIVVDNDSTDGTREFLEDFSEVFPDLILILHNDNKGVAFGRNSGFAAASGKFIVALDDDSSIETEQLRKIPILFETHSYAGILAFRVQHSITGEYQNDHGKKLLDVANHHGAGFSLRKDLLVKIGSIDESCDYGAEELDFAIKVHSAGYQVVYVPDVIVKHNSFLRDDQEEKRRRERRVFNNVRVYYKHFPKGMARLHSLRYAFGAIFSWLQVFGPKDLQKLFNAVFSGRRSGLSVYRAIPPETVIFYSNPGLRPEVGNVPIMWKIAKTVKRWLKLGGT